jgi:hypothetical protein
MDLFAALRKGLSSPADEHYEITPSSDVLSPKPRALKVLTDGTVTIEDKHGRSIEYTVTSGDLIQFRAHKVTAATADIVAWY